MSVEWRLRFLLVALTALGSCRRPTCPQLAGREDVAATAKVCAATFERSNDADAGLFAAQALVKLRQDDHALALASRLLDGVRGADARQLMARVYLARGAFDVARPLLEEALRRHRARDDHAGAYGDAAVLVTAYWGRSEFAEALALAKLACAEARAAGDRRLYATSLIALGSVFQAVGDNERALETYAQASAELAPGDQAGRARVLIYRSVLLLEERQLALARPLLEQARTLAAQAQDASLVLAAEVNLSDIALRQGDLEVAERHLASAESAWRASGDTSPSQGILLNRAILARERGDFPTATQAMATAAAAADSAPETAEIFAYERGQLAAAMKDVAAAERHYLEAIELVEEMWRTASPEDLRAPFFEDRWQPYLSLFALRVERRDPLAAFAAVVAAQGRMFLAETVTATARARSAIERRGLLRALGAAVAESPISNRLSAAETLKALRDRYVLNYFSDGHRMRLLILDRGRVRLTSVDVELARLEQLVDDFLARSDDPALAAALGEAIVPPEELAAAPRRFHVIPAGPLLRVPFAALRPGGQRLLDRYDLVYAPSATALAGLTSFAAGAGLAPGAAVLLGDARGDLRHGAEEIAAVVSATKAVAQTGAAATIEALRAAHDAALLHIVGHSGIGIDGGFLVLADGQVSAAEILQWRLRPRLVVLASCASAASNRRDMWGSLAVAFLAAGSREVVATLFSVQDQEAAEFVKRFYRDRGVLDPVAATAAAQRDLARNHPTSAWSAFMVIGL
jgi:tetratricopeptide (TPR) repeat protein